MAEQKPSSPIKALIIDDERLARNDLKSLLAAHPRVEIAGEADSIASAVPLLRDLKPDVVFLDIQMPGESGFDLLEHITPETHIIFVTAYDEYAIRAFEVNALDYLLKPVHPDRLAQSLERLESEAMPSSEIRELTPDDRLFLMIDNHMCFLKIRNIISICAAGDYSEILTKDGVHGLTLKSMKEWEARLPRKIFCRIHRSTIINMDAIERLEEWFNYSYRVYLKGVEKPHIMSRRYAARLKNRLG